ncbi:MAG: phosphoserine phosphatase SerB [Candidatus Puniceispirillaceae bacterium]
MQACILFTASPQTPETAAVITDLCQHYKLEKQQTLSGPEASCLAIEARMAASTDAPLAFTALREAAALHKIDVNQIQAPETQAPETQAAGRAKKLLIADMDATIIRGESLDELAELAGIGAQVSQITARAMAGELDFEEALSARLALLKGQPASLLDKVISGAVITPGAQTLIATMRANGAACYLISGGFTFLTSAIAAKLGFTGHHANQLAVADGQLSGYALPPILGKQSKLDFLNHYCQQMQIPHAQSICVGDGANDMMMLEAAGMGVAFEGKPALRAAIELQISYSDLTALLYLQGYSSDNFSK